MPTLYDRLTPRKEKDLRVLTDFIGIYCREKHPDKDKSPFVTKDFRLELSFDGKEVILCQDCQKLLNHGIAKRLQCPHDPKPMCKRCQTHCYAPGYRDKIREVMRFSGLYLVTHGRFDLMFHYFL